MVRMKKNAKGEMEYEIKETYIDENGVKREIWWMGKLLKTIKKEKKNR